MNDSGAVVGTSASGYHFVWRAGTTMSLPLVNQGGLPWQNLWTWKPVDINEAGTVLGWAYSAQTGYRLVPFRMQSDGTVEVFQHPNPNVSWMEPKAINKHGDVVGIISSHDRPGMRGFLLRRGILFESNPHYTDSLYVESIADSGKMVGWTQSWDRDWNQTREMVTVEFEADSDGDGLLDTWEMNGLEVDGHFVDLPAMGADPMHKDVFVEVDYMNRPLSSRVVQTLMQSFADAPVTNPDGTTGINLHIDTGPRGIMRADNATWGSLSQANAVPFQEKLGTTQVGANGKDDYVSTEAEAIRRTHFKKRRGVFHYAILANLLGGAYSGTTSGIAWDDTLGIAGAHHDTHDKMSATLMHVLGHHFGLDRSGVVDEPNREPNYLSVMNYRFPDGLIRRDTPVRQFDYSRFSLAALPDIDDSQLDESQGAVAHGDAADFYSGYNCPHSAATVRLIAFNEPVNWNCDGVTSGALPPTNINKDRDQNGNPVLSVLTAHDDWPAVQLGRSIGPQRLAMSEADASTELRLVPMEEPFSPEEWNARRPYTLAAAFSPSQQAVPGARVVYTVRVKNIGMFRMETEQEIVSESGWADTSQVPTYLSLDEGEEATFTLTVNIPVTAYPGDVDELGIEILERNSRQAKVGTVWQTTVVEGVSLAADAGMDLVIPCTSTVNTPVTLDASGSSGAEGVALDYRWSGSFGSASGAKPSVNFPLGQSTVTLTVSDGSHSAQDMQQVSVQVGVSGFAAPLSGLVEEGQPVILPDAAMKQGRTLPLKLTLSCGGAKLTADHVAAPRIVSIAREGAALPLDTVEVNVGQGSDSGYVFRSSEGQWVYNLSTAGLSTGTYHITLELPDGRRVVGGFVLR